MNVVRILRHPRAAVVAHDLLMVGVAWLAAGWIFHQGGVPGIMQSCSLLSELLMVLVVQGFLLRFGDGEGGRKRLGCRWSTF